ncbi:hypothetical protein BO70DRAFT_417845 [Aspergillus heteromorphus CBS 117.55]|uniref:Glucosyl-3-phosphoglycerate synthase n=1 Tax=Aspergillus heteromorphus CBS 117.55 TaxID=1448321 RepID=A0A317WR19_9EURO|nr:uncharacterized protein BO70DRAFT_417845 [Aspergillus heteromorphus CBS 117.55]PWY88954.1 hypothetical protein BO70DRAFT_417845 [Aspergillus heteromorphus CBS 117.55]
MSPMIPNSSPPPPESPLSNWLQRNRFSHDDFPLEDLSAAVREQHLHITVIIPGKEVASTVGGVIQQAVQPLIDARIVRNVYVIDAASKDGTATAATSAGAQVLQRAGIAPELGCSQGKGDALWRGLLATDGDIVAFLDGDTKDPVPAHLLGILGPLIMFDHIQMVRSCYDRPFQTHTGDILPHEGGRVTEILARPVLNLHWPDLAGFRQPLAGEFAARRSLLNQLSFPVGYGVEIGTLIDAYLLVGLHALAEVDVGQRQNAHKALRDLTTMAYTVLATAEQRISPKRSSSDRAMYLPWLGEYRDNARTERPPLRDYRSGQFMYPSPPFVAVEGVRMFRDIGSDDASPMRSGLVFRSGDPSKLTPAGLQTLLDLGITTIFDLRSRIEMTQHLHGNGHATHEPSCSLHGMHREWEIYPYQLAKAGIKRVIAPVFPDDEWLQEKRDARLKHYSNAAEGYASAYHHTLLSGASPFLPILQHLSAPPPPRS